MTSVTCEIETKSLSAEELLEMGDTGSCELMERKIKSTCPAEADHGFVEFQLAMILDDFVREKKPGWILFGGVGIITHRDPDTVRGADIVFISKNRLPNRPQRKFLDIAPELVVEIISPQDNRKDIRDKIEEYFQIGVKCVWLVESPDDGCT
ncbi:hypothetical protein GWN42_09800 [candidate division KSB1 bacterium]|nr:hypothetical protein [candidate division KSB1 bacterium]